MTEHFTREEAVTLAVEAMKSNPNHEEAGMCITMRSYEWHNLLNAAVTAKLKEWEAQGEVAGWLHELPDGSFHFSKVDPSNHDPQELADAEVVITKLYTHALPAQPAEPVMPIDGWKVKVRGSNQQLHCTGIYGDTVFVDLPAEPVNAPGVGVPDGYVLVPVEPTQEMIRHCRITPCTADEMDADDDYRAVYKAMIASAQPQQKEG